MKHYNSDDERFRGEVLNAAKAYIAKGWHVFPLHSIKADGECTCGKLACSDAGKHPRLSRGLKEASADPQKIEEWFGQNAPLSNVGIVTGAVSGCTVLDIDTAPGKGGDETWAEIVREHGEAQTLMAHTGSGGFHLLFAYNSALKTAANVLGKGIDCRNDGGYVVAAPSRHRSGGVYSWMNEGEPLAVLPAHLSRRKEGRGRPRKDNPFTAKYTLEQVRGMLAVIPADDRDFWRAVGIVLGREFNRADGAFQVYVEWANKWGGKKGRNHDAIQHEAFYELSQQGAEKELSIGTIVHAATKHGWVPKKGEVSPEQFVYVGESNNYLYKPTLRYWTANAVDVVCSPVNVEGKIIKAGDWIKEHITDMGLDDAAGRREYFSDLWDWFLAGGASHVAAYLHERDISRFSASNGQRKTEAHHSVVQIGRERHAWLYDILEELGHPEFVSFPSIREHAKCNGEDISNLGVFTGRAKAALEDAGYIKYRNPKTSDGRWYKAGLRKGFVIYAKVGTPQGLDPRDLVKADGELF